MQSTLTIEGMRTVHCVRAIFTALGGLSGVQRAHVEMGLAVVDHDRTLSRTALAAAIAQAGYELREVHRDARTLPTLPTPTDE